jgi:hypothetical protein
MLHEFAGTPYEREEGIHEESRGHRELHGVLCLELTTPREHCRPAVPVLTMPRRSHGRAVVVLTTPPLRLGNGSECVGSSSELETTRPAYAGVPRESHDARDALARQPAR